MLLLKDRNFWHGNRVGHLYTLIYTNNINKRIQVSKPLTKAELVIIDNNPIHTIPESSVVFTNDPIKHKVLELSNERLNNSKQFCHIIQI